MFVVWKPNSEKFCLVDFFEPFMHGEWGEMDTEQCSECTVIQLSATTVHLLTPELRVWVLPGLGV